MVNLVTKWHFLYQNYPNKGKITCDFAKIFLKIAFRTKSDFAFQNRPDYGACQQFNEHLATHKFVTGNDDRVTWCDFMLKRVLEI